MNDPFDPTPPPFVPPSNPWSIDYKMQHQSALLTAGQGLSSQSGDAPPQASSITLGAGANWLRPGFVPGTQAQAFFSAASGTISGSATTAHPGLGSFLTSESSTKEDLGRRPQFQPFQSQLQSQSQNQNQNQSQNQNQNQNQNHQAQAQAQALNHQGATPVKSTQPATPVPRQSPGVPGLLPDDTLSDTLGMDVDENAEEIVADLKLQVGSLITAIAMISSKGGVSTLQGADGVEVAHRIMNRLKALRQENECLGKLVSGTRAAELEASVLKLEKENAQLKQQVRDFRQRERASR